MNEILNLIVNAIFSGSLILLICLLLIKLFKVSIHPIKYKILINAVNYTLLLGSMLYLFMLIVYLYIGFFSGGEYEQFAVSDRLFGSYWWALWIFTFVPYAVLPQLLWSERFRQSIVGVSIVMIPWAVILLLKSLGNYQGFHFEWSHMIIDNLKDILLYLPILIAVYTVLTLRKKHSGVESTDL
ncbi:MAG: hypothetical protein JO080_14455 [Mucilaginibacter sp.]|nr:hypothetical protein [Mucilaginibacter sp.]